MGYRLGQGKTRDYRTMLFWVSALLCAFAIGGAISFMAVRHFHVSAYDAPTAKTAYVSQQASRIPTGVLAMASGSILIPKSSSSLGRAGSGGSGGIVQAVRLSDCGGVPPARAGLVGSTIAELRKVAEYEQVCGGAIIDRASIFVGTPASVAQANDDAGWVASVLKEFARNGISPLIFMEPTLPDGGLIDAGQYRNGAYDGALDAFFAALKANGVTDAMMGTWVPWPEGNIPVWSSVDPGDFVANVTKTAQIQKQYFPASKVALLLESKTYPSATNWSGGVFKSLLPYVQGIPAGLVDSFGLQGFAWPPTGPNEEPQLDAKSFLRVDFAAEAAHALGASEVWLNTGTFGTSYVVSRSKPFVLNLADRQQALNGIVAQAKALKAKGFQVSVHLFAQNKGGTAEAIDWSYWPAGQANISPATGIFKTLVHDLRDASVGLWLYDS